MWLHVKCYPPWSLLLLWHFPAHILELTQPECLAIFTIYQPHFLFVMKACREINIYNIRKHTYKKQLQQEKIKVILLGYLSRWSSLIYATSFRNISLLVAKISLLWYVKRWTALRETRYVIKADARNTQIVQEGLIYSECSRSISIVLREHLHVTRHEGDMI